MASFRAPQPAVPAASTSSLSTGHSQTNIANTFDIEPALKHTQLHQIGIGLLRASKNKIPKDPSFHEAFARDMERIFDPTRLNPDDQTGNGLSQMNLDDEFWSDPAQWHPDDQIGEGLTERRSHNHEGLTQDILMNEDQNEQPVIGWNAKAGAFSGLGVSWDMLVSGPREAADVGTKPARRNKNAEASTSASSSPLRCVQEQGVSKAPSKARTAERPIFGTGSDNPAHRYIFDATCD
ncbi:hypothetical protein FRB91_002152 [Serendipita sp. 411]|nr:hypothetical protein FRB91_002152 [Serendipita sp. 411]